MKETKTLTSKTLQNTMERVAVASARLLASPHVRLPVQ